MRDPYTILGVSKNSTFAEIKTVYLKLVKKYHPDVTDLEDTHLIMIEINGAYEFLQSHHIEPKNTNKKTTNESNNKTKNENVNKEQNNRTKEKTDQPRQKKNYTKEEWDKFWEKYWEEKKAQRAADYAKTSMKMKSRVSKILEPIRRENNDFYKQINNCKTYDEIVKVTNEHYRKVDEMIKFMYDYTEKCHKYGLPTYYKYGHKTFNTNVKVSKDFPLIEVNSSHLIAIGYDKDNNVLYIKFTNNGLYVYYCVSPELYNDFISSTSKGRFFEEHIRNEYDYKRII